MTTSLFAEAFNILAGDGITATEFNAHGGMWVGIAVDDAVFEIYGENQIEEFGKSELVRILIRAGVFQFARTQRNAKVVCNHPMRKTFEEILIRMKGKTMKETYKDDITTNEEFCNEFNKEIRQRCSFGAEAIVDAVDGHTVNIYIGNKLWTRIVEPRLYEKELRNLIVTMAVDTKYLVKQFSPKADSMTAEDFCAKLIEIAREHHEVR